MGWKGYVSFSAGTSVFFLLLNALSELYCLVYPEKEKFVQIENHLFVFPSADSHLWPYPFHPWQCCCMAIICFIGR